MSKADSKGEVTSQVYKPCGSYPYKRCGTCAITLTRTSIALHSFMLLLLLLLKMQQTSVSDFPINHSSKLRVTQCDQTVIPNFTSSLGNRNPPVITVFATTPQTLLVFINSTIHVAHHYGFDGLHLHWDFSDTPRQVLVSEPKSYLELALSILTVILIGFAGAAVTMIMPSFPLRSIVNLSRFVSPSHLLLTSIASLLRSIPRHEGFGVLLQELASMVQRKYPNSPPFDENSARMYTFMISKCIYKFTGDVITGSLASTTLISFMISRDETPTYVFVIWAISICLVLCLKNNGTAIGGDDSDSATDGDSTASV